MIELSSRFLTASPSTRCWDSYGTFVTPLKKLGSPLCRRHVTPQHRSTFFLHELFFHASLFCAICLCLVLLLSRLMNIFVNVILHLFPKVYLLQKYCSLVKEDSVRMRGYILHERFCFTFFASLIFVFCVFFKINYTLMVIKGIL